MSYGPANDDYGRWNNPYSRTPDYMRIPANLEHVKIESSSVAEAEGNSYHPTEQGSALIAKHPIPTTEQACSVGRPAMAALDTPRLKDTCYNCYATTEEANLAPSRGTLRWNFNTEDVIQRPLGEGRCTIKLKTCGGCKAVKFCGQTCQKTAWDSHHKFECPIYAALQPRILPNNVRAVIRLLLQKKFNRLPEKLWEDINSLESHIDKLRRAGGSKWEDLIIMAQGTKEYSKTDQDFNVVLKLLCILMINSFTLMTVWNDPIGLCLHPLLARINHSCQPNAFIHFPINRKHDLLIMPLRKIKRREQITIAYIDTTNSFERRQEQLYEQYLFNCTCPKCVSDKSIGTSTMLNSDNLKTVEKKALQLLEGAGESTSISVRIEKLRYALFLLKDTKTWPVQRDPCPRLLHELILAYIDNHQFNVALAYAALQYLRLDPEVYEHLLHPTRLTHCLLLARLMAIASYGEEWASQTLDLRPFKINFTWWRRYLMFYMQSALTKTDLPNLVAVAKEEQQAAERAYSPWEDASEQELDNDENINEATKTLGVLMDWADERLEQWHTS